MDWVGQTLSQYHITAKLGEGGMGVVYKALDTRLNRPVAIKFLPPDALAQADRRQRFVQEARAASALNHSNIVHIYAIESSARQDYIVMEFVDGATLDELLKKKPLPLDEGLGYAGQLADALAEAHAAGIAGGKAGNAFLFDVNAGPSQPPEPLPPFTAGGEYFEPTSWSPDGKWLAGHAIDWSLRGTHPGIVLYSLKDGTYERLTDFGESATWLPDSRRLLFSAEGKLHLLDRVTRETRLVLSVPPPEELGDPRLSRFGRQLFVLRSIDEADIWMAELK